MSDSRFDMSASNPEWLRRLNAAGRSMMSSGGSGAMVALLDAESLPAGAVPRGDAVGCCKA